MNTTYRFKFKEPNTSGNPQQVKITIADGVNSIELPISREAGAPLVCPPGLPSTLHLASFVMSGSGSDGLGHVWYPSPNPHTVTPGAANGSNCSWTGACEGGGTWTVVLVAGQYWRMRLQVMAKSPEDGSYYDGLVGFYEYRRLAALPTGSYSLNVGASNFPTEFMPSSLLVS